MADSIVRLRVDTKDYDANIKTARQGLLQMEQACRKVGGTFEYVEKAELEYVRALGQMETKSQSVKGKIGELTAAYTDLRAEYNRMTDAEKSSEFGKALNASLEQMKGRIAGNRQEFQNISGEIGNTSGVLDQLSSAFGVNIGQLTKFGGLVGVATTALGVAKDAFMQTEGNIDEWGRTVKGAEGAYDIFLQTLNNGNWSNFFQNLSTAIRGARDLYDSLDRLGSIKSNNQAAIAIQQQKVQQLRLLKQQGKDVDAQLKTATAQLARLQKQAVTAGKKAGADMIGETIRNGYNSQKGAGRISKGSVDRTVQDIVQNGQAAFDKYARFVKKIEGNKAYYRNEVHSDMDGNRYTVKRFDITKLNKEQQKQYNLSKTITDRETEIQKGIAVYAQAVQEGASSAREEFKGNRYALIGARGIGGGRRGGGGGGGGNTEADRVAEQVKKAQQDVADTITKWKAGLIKNEDYDKAMQQAQSKLADAYLNAANVTGNAKYMQGFKDAAEKASSLAAGIDYENEQQKEAAEAARKLKAAQEKLAAAQEEAGNAQKSGDLGAFYQAQKKIKAAGGTVAPVNAGDFSATTANISAYIAHLKEEISKSDIGSDIYNKLTENIADANAFSGVISEMVKNGVQLADIDPQALGKRILSGENIEDMDWETIQDALNEKFKEMEVDPIKINLNTGDISKDEEGDDKEWDKFKDKYGKLTSGLSQVASGLQQVGIKIPDEITRVISVMQGIMTVIQGVETVISIFSSSTQTANTVAVGLNTAALAANTAALATNSVSNFLPFANGGIVGRAAGGMLIPGNSKSGDRLRMPVSSGGFIGVNSGELILNAAQQNNLANGLQGAAGLRNLQLSAVIHGEDIMLVIDNVGERRGDGEYITAKFA